MLNLLDKLSPLDNKRIENYIHKYAIEDDYIGNAEYLYYWAECKKHLYHLLGGRLIYKFPISFEKPAAQTAKEIEDLLSPVNSPFVSKFYHKIETDEFMEFINQSRNTRTDFNSLLWASTFKADKIPATIKIKPANFKRTLQLQAGMKPIRALQRVIDYFEWDDLRADFEKFRVQHSFICSDKKITGNFCLSIHPLDFMTMSDNNSNWSSCMSWTNKGCYHLGTVEMMNSNNVICGYIEASDDWNFSGGDAEGKEWTWNNKKWRQLFYVTNEIAVCGKAYPYQHKDFSIAALDKIKELSEQNLHRTYTFGVEPYRDMIHIGSNYRMNKNRKWIRYNKAKKHNIIFDTNGMYNDMFNDHDGYDDIYWCYRNKVKKNTIICYSGKATCVCCGQEILEEGDLEANYDGAYNDRYGGVSGVLCSECKLDRKCSHCGREGIRVIKFNHENYCPDCAERLLKVCPSCGDTYMQRSSDSWGQVFGRLSDAPIHQQDFYANNLYDPEKQDTDNINLNRTDIAKHPIAQLCMCDRCITKAKNEEKVRRIVPPADPDRMYYSWRSKEPYIVWNETIDSANAYWTKFFRINLVPAKVE
jgi:hypothetical protein